jgi:hypothetical protein
MTNMTLQEFIAFEGLKREVPYNSSRLENEPGDYFLSDAGSMGTRIDYAKDTVIDRCAFVKKQ